ncbi:MAG: hypothetical protein ABSF89_16315 [Acidimicrobiales bacterium]|jgi:hypothetical protein
MRTLRHPIATFIVAVLAVIGVGVGVLAATMPLDHTPSTIARYPPFPPSSPGSFDSCIARKPTGLTTAQATRIIDRVNVIAVGQLQMTAACPGGPVLIGLTPGNEPLAHRLLADYGRNMAIFVGLTTYNGSPGRSPRCGRLTPSAALPLGLHFALQLKHKSVSSGRDFFGTVVVSEHGSGSFSMDTGQPLEAVLVRPGTLQVVGVESEGIAGTGYLTHLSSGKTSTIPVVGGTARCDGGLGSALPPGTYQVIVRVAPEGRHQSPAYLTPPVTLRVTA